MVLDVFPFLSAFTELRKATFTVVWTPVRQSTLEHMSCSTEFCLILCWGLGYLLHSKESIVSHNHNRVINHMAELIFWAEAVLSLRANLFSHGWTYFLSGWTCYLSGWTYFQSGWTCFSPAELIFWSGKLIFWWAELICWTVDLVSHRLDSFPELLNLFPHGLNSFSEWLNLFSHRLNLISERLNFFSLLKLIFWRF